MKQIDINKLEKQVKYRLAEGDLIFSSIDLLVCRKVARETGSWSSHVGLAINENNQWMIVESKVPFVCKTPLRKFLQRTRHGQIMVRRLKQPLSDDQIKKVKLLASNHIGKLYHPGFDFNSGRQFCSKLVNLIYKEAMGVELGTVQTLEQLLNQNPQARIGLWYFWYFGNIPLNRKTLTPASQLQDQQLQTVFSTV